MGERLATISNSTKVASLSFTWCSWLDHSGLRTGGLGTETRTNLAAPQWNPVARVGEAVKADLCWTRSKDDLFPMGKMVDPGQIMDAR